jgi:two-component system, sensor histidine kinase
MAEIRESALVGKRILVIDDSPTVCAFVRDMLGPEGVLLDEVFSGREALALGRDQKYDLILLDLRLPDISGLEVLRQIREHNDQCAIMILTSNGDVQTAIEAVENGADSYIQKQELTARHDRRTFFYDLKRALERRAGLVARQQLEEMEHDFYAKITHDLRSPSSAILTSAELLLSEDYGPLNGAQQELLEIVQRMAIRMHELINRYLDFAKIDAGYLELNPTRVDLGRLLQNSGVPSRVEMNQKGQTVVYDLPRQPIYAWVDAKRLQQAVDNLLNNAMKYTPRGGRIMVRLKQTADEALIEIRDTGQGIPPEELGGLFTKYHRVPGPLTARVRGFGLGLYIVKEITEAHGGAVWAESTGIPGQGTSFFVKIPLQQEPELAAV